ncbi:MAG: TetR family transcriptional regulator [Oscillospiraceae bacterium]|nr:TetR family transcriptional regulator [Oscillospiraceae bacterium]
MPHKTFFNLSDQKRETFLSAAREEFARVTYDQVSINRIIRAAHIPRGSFYMYFTDKADLFRYLLDEYANKIVKIIETILQREKGDLFATFQTLFDFSLGFTSGTVMDADLSILGQTLENNLSMRNGDMLSVLFEDHRLYTFLDYIDTSQLAVSTPDDLRHMVRILSCVSVPFFVQCMKSENIPPHLQQQYTATLNILRRGFCPTHAAQPEPAASL